MSDELFTDIEDLDALIQECETAGAQVLQASAGFRGDVSDAISRFETTMSKLNTQVGEFESEMNADVDALRDAAEGVHWEGNARQAFLGDVGTFRGTVNTSCSKLRESINTIVTEVNTRFAGSLEEASAQNQKAAASIEESMATLSKEGASARADVDRVDASWTGAL